MPEHAGGRKPLQTLVLAFLLLASLLIAPSTLALAEGDIHHLVFASDYHNTEGAIATALAGMPQDTEYVSMIGDMVGGRGNMTPEYQSSAILGLVQESLPGITSDRFSIVWGSHDANVQDEGTNVVKCNGGYGSGVIYEGKDSDGTTAYYIYAIGFYEMTRGGTTSSDAASAFKDWVDGVDETIPVIVLCHVPVQALRADNRGAIYWSEALNYAATGVSGISSEDANAQIKRNVIFLCAHNHTVSEYEFYFPAGRTLTMQIDTSGEEEEMPPGPSADMPEMTEETQGQPIPGSAEGADDQTRPRPPRREPRGVVTRIYYTSLVAGYLKTHSNATLMTIADDSITLQKFSGGQQVDLGYDGQAEEPVTGSVVIPQFVHAEEVDHGSVQISAIDEAEAVLEGAAFGLYPEGEPIASEPIATFQGGTFEVSSADESLAQLLPAVGETLTLALRETAVPQGYEQSVAEHVLTISATQEDTFDAESRRYTTTIAYEVRIDGEDRLSVAHAKQKVVPADVVPTASEAAATTTVAAATQSVAVTKTATANATATKAAKSPATSLPKTGDATPMPYAAVLAGLGVALLAAAGLHKGCYFG